jgi:NADH:ubiquinone oxidoreductase subunit D
MKNVAFCQSCSMPMLSSQLLGTEKDGSKNQEYCKYCYKDGSFTQPQATLQEMITQVICQMENMHMDLKIIDKTVELLPQLKRWQFVNSN